MIALNKAFDIVRLGLHSLLTHKVRSILTSLGIIFGVFSVIAMLSINKGFSYEAQKSLRELGSNNIIIESIKPPDDGTKASTGGVRALHYGLTESDVAALADNIPGVQQCVASHQTLKFAHVDENNFMVNVIGTEPTFASVAQINMTSGRFISSGDLLRCKPHCVITDALSRRLFDYDDPLGQTVRLGGEPFVVIGTLASLPKSMATGGDAGQYVIVPLTTDRKRFGELTAMWGAGGGTLERVEFSQIVLQMESDKDVLPAAKIARSLLDRKHTKKDYVVTVPLELLAQMEKQRWLWNFMFVVIASVSLLVGGIGIMNIMLASVTERTREIGIRRALGAKRKDIVVQFLVESVTLTTAGGLLGIAIGLIIPFIVSELLNLVTIITPGMLILPFAMAALIGLVSGLYPAMRAAKLDPIIALRHE